MLPIDSSDTIIVEGQSHHEGQFYPPSVRPARHLRALHRHIFVLLVVTPRDHSSFAAPKCIQWIKKGEGKGRKRRWKEGLGDWPADWRLDRNCNGVESWSRRQSMSLSSSSAAPLLHSAWKSLPRHESEESRDLYVRNHGPEKGRDVNHLLRLHTSRSLSSPIDHADSWDYLLAIIRMISRINSSTVI